MKGILQQIKEDKDIKPMENLTEERLRKVLNDISTSLKGKNVIKTYQSCLTYGVVERSEIDLNICANPKCTSCRQMSKLMDEEMKKLYK